MFVRRYLPVCERLVQHVSTEAACRHTTGLPAAETALVIHLSLLLVVKEVSQAIYAAYWKMKRRPLTAPRASQHGPPPLVSSLALDATDVTEEGGVPGPAATVGSRLVRYWALISEAVQNGRRKPPSPVTTLEHVVDRSGTVARGSWMDPRGDTVLVLPLGDCFAGDTGGPTAAGSPWGSLYLLWTDAVRYAVPAGAIRTMILDSLPAPHTLCVDPHAVPAALDVAAANLAIAWYLANVRCVHDALITQQDTMRATDALEEMRFHAAAMYARCIAPWPRHGSGPPRAVASRDASSPSPLPHRVILSCSPRDCWEVLDKAATQLRRHSRRMTRQHVGSLFRYMYGTSAAKLFSGACIAGLTAMSSRVAVAGVLVRNAVSHVLTVHYASASPSGERAVTRWDHATAYADRRRVAVEVAILCGFELLRLTVNVSLTGVARRFISASASHRRDTMKAELYMALAHMPITFFDTYDSDEVEGMVYYVNDLEGVDVHLHNYFYSTAIGLLAARSALAGLGPRARGWVLGTVATSYAVHWIGTVVAAAYKQFLKDCIEKGCTTGGWDDQDADDAQTWENVSSAQRSDGIMLRGLEIITAVPQLRPYGADVSLMKWWGRYVERRQSQSRAGRHVLRYVFTYGELLPTLGCSLLVLVNWFLPVLVSVYVAATASDGGMNDLAAFSNRLLDATTAVRSAVEGCLDARRIVEVVACNAYKASQLERILDPTSWEDCRLASATTHDTDLSWIPSTASLTTGSVLQPPVGPLPAKPRPTLHVSRVVVNGLTFAYPANPTVPIFVPSLSCDIVLADPQTGHGRMVSLVGPSGGGKSTLLHLLLGLYTPPSVGFVEAAAGESSAWSREASSTTPSIALCLSREDEDTSNHDGVGPPLPTTTTMVNLDRIPRHVLRRQLFSYVPQQPAIFAGATIAHNISLQAYVSIEETDVLARVVQCATAARCDFIHKFPQGVLTTIGDATAWGGGGVTGVGEGGFVRLSGGQAQRLMLARALYHGGGILLLDEPTSGLDSETRTVLLHQWRELLGSAAFRGIICVTHDEAVMRASDEVICIGGT